MFKKFFGGSSSDSYSCSFCGKGHSEVTKLIAGPGIYICNECTDVCSEILTQEQPVQQIAHLRNSVELLLKLRNNGDLNPATCNARIAEATLQWFGLPDPEAKGGTLDDKPTDR